MSLVQTDNAPSRWDCPLKHLPDDIEHHTPARGPPEQINERDPERLSQLEREPQGADAERPVMSLQLVYDLPG